MTHVADLVMETTATMGVGAITLMGPVDGFFSFAESFADGDSVFYCQRQKGGGREVVRGTFTAPNILSRDEILRSSVPGDPTAPVNWGDGTRVVYSCLPAGQVLLAENVLSEIATFLIAGNHLSEIAALGGAAQDASLGNLGGLATGIALLKAATAAAARGTLGLGSAAVLAAGTAAGNAVALDGAGKLPAVPGDQLTSLPGHTHSVLVSSMTGGANNRLCRQSASMVVTEASTSDTPAQLSALWMRGSTTLLYAPGSEVPVTGVALGTTYWLDSATPGVLTATPPASVDGTHACVRVGRGIATGVLAFQPVLVAVEETGFSETKQTLYHQVGYARLT